jgi:hypothetical protein
MTEYYCHAYHYENLNGPIFYYYVIYRSNAGNIPQKIPPCQKPPILHLVIKKPI